MSLRLTNLVGFGGGGDPVAQGVDFNGTTNYVDRSSALTGDADGKNFTFSAFVKIPASVTPVGQQAIYTAEDVGGKGVEVYFNDATLILFCRDSGGANAVVATVNINFIDLYPDQYVNYLISVGTDSTSTRHIYINDIDVSASTVWSTYIVSSVLKFTTDEYYIPTDRAQSRTLECGLSNMFFDYNYRNFSVTGNRRVFVDADGNPTRASTLTALNPILYLPMFSAGTVNLNYGTGGDFVSHGTFT